MHNFSIWDCIGDSPTICIIYLIIATIIIFYFASHDGGGKSGAAL